MRHSNFVLTLRRAIGCALLLIAPDCGAQTIFRPGELSVRIPIRAFVRPEVFPACDALSDGELKKARELFSDELAVDPEHLGVWAGMIQSRIDTRDALLSEFRDELAKQDTPVRRFRVGLVALYKWDLDYRAKGDRGSSESTAWMNLAALNLESAWKRSRNPIAGFAYAIVYPYYHRSGVSKVYEDIIRHGGSPGDYRAYEAAKRTSWRATPPAPTTLPRERLAAIRYAVGMLYSIASSYPSNPTKAVLAERQRQITFLKAWRDKLRARYEQSRR